MSIAPDVGHHPAARSRTVTAVLGPTNTGKTHLAIERMLAHESGIIGLPLRLLAREVYTRVVERVGADAVALITGEEKIKPDNPRYWVSTVEAMPRDLDVAFVAIDEVQIAADLDRGHVFTDRILRRRGREETLLLGAATMQPILTRMMPNLNVVTRPRLSNLSYSGQKKITRLPRRSAVVAFSANDVYAVAELIRRQRGGAAVVLGALSPRTRNAQVGLYESGDVDFLVATDAIGMGLNLDVDHVAFAARRKFDGWQFRDLNPSELGQIAGRAGRYMQDGTFGVTGRVDPLENELVERLENHDFDPVSMLQWRSVDLDYATLNSLRESLAAPPREAMLTRAPPGDDVLALEAVAADPELIDMTTDRSAVERLWDVCQVPDYRKIAPANHAELVSTLYSQLMRQDRVDDDWFGKQIAQCDRTSGDIDTLSNRIAHIRTWTFVANRPDWLADPVHWQERARAVEDRLSDALHEQLVQRFVDRRTSVLARSLRENPTMEAEIDAAGDVTVEGHHVGLLEGLRFTPDPEADGNHLKTITAAARRTLSGELTKRAERLAKDADEVIMLALDGTMSWRGSIIGRVEKGATVLSPRIVLLADENLTGAARENAEARLAKWVDDKITTHLGQLKALEADETITGMTRGLAFQLCEALGILERPRVAEEVRALSQEDRAALRRHGVRFAAHHIYMPLLLKPGPRVLAAQLWALHHGGPHQPGFAELAALAQSGRMSVSVLTGSARSLYRAFGFRACGGRAVRVDILERIADQIRAALSWRREGGAPPPPGAIDGRVFTVSEQMTSLAGCAGDDFAEILKALGYRSETRPAPVEPVAPQVEAAAPDETAPGVTASAEAASVEAAPVETAATDETSASETPAEQAPEQAAENQTEASAEPAATAGESAAPSDSAAAEADNKQEEAGASGEPVPVVPEPVSEPAPALAAAPEPVSVVATAETDATETKVAEPDTSEPDNAPVATLEEGSTEMQAGETATGETSADATASTRTDAVAETAPSEDAAKAEATAESAEITVWRPGRRPDAPRRHKPAQKADKQGDSGANSENRPKRGEAKGRKGRGGGQREGARDGAGGGARGGARTGAREENRDGGRGGQRDGHKGPRRGSKSAGNRSDQKRPNNHQHRDRRPPKEPDPLSPFAALKKLRDELAKQERPNDA